MVFSPGFKSELEQLLDVEGNEVGLRGYRPLEEAKQIGDTANRWIMSGSRLLEAAGSDQEQLAALQVIFMGRTLDALSAIASRLEAS